MESIRGLSGFSFVFVFSQLLILIAEGQKLSTQKQHSGSRHQNESLAHSCSVLRKQADVNLNTGSIAWQHFTGFLHSFSSSVIPSPAAQFPTSPLLKPLASQGSFKHLGRFWRKKINGARRASQITGKELGG